MTQINPRQFKERYFDHTVSTVAGRDSCVVTMRPYGPSCVIPQPALSGAFSWMLRGHRRQIVLDYIKGTVYCEAA